MIYWQICIQITTLSSDRKLEETKSNKKLKCGIFAVYLVSVSWFTN